MFHTLPLTVFEEYMLLDGSSVYPMECHVRYRFSGGFNHQVLEKILANELALNPLLYAHCRERKPYRYDWEIPDYESETSKRIQHFEGFSTILGVRLYWLEGPCRADYPAIVQESLDVFKEAMIRMYCVEEKDASGKVVRTDFIFKCHHSASDGKGIFRLFSDFLVEYARAMGLNMPEWEKREKVDVSLLPKRGNYGRSLFRNLLWKTICPFNLHRSLRFICRKVAPLASWSKPTEEELQSKKSPEGFPHILFHKKSREWTTEILKKCKEKKCTFNDLMLQAVWCGTKAWKVKHPECAYNGEREWFRISVPQDLRTPALEHLPAANIVSMVFCDRKESEIDESDRFRTGIQKEMQHIKKFHLGFLLIEGMKNVRFFVGNLKNAMEINDCWTSMVLTNLGPLLTPKMLPFPRNEEGKIQIGELVLDEIDSASPIRHWTNVSLCCITYAGEMQFSLIYDSLCMTQAEAESYLDAILGKIDEI